MVAETKWQSSPVSVEEGTSWSDVHLGKLEVVAVPTSHNRPYDQKRVVTSRINGTYDCLQERGELLLEGGSGVPATFYLE